jgi:Zn-dependent M32 family carboxypeptidase
MPNSVKSNQIGCGAKNKNENKTMSKYLQKTLNLKRKKSKFRNHKTPNTKHVLKLLI